MLMEWVKNLTTPCPWHLRRMGYLKETIGLEARYNRCRRAWDEHLQNARAAILHAAADCPDKHRVVILGSGSLLDIPLEDLSAIFHEVVLVDILHIPEVWRRGQRLGNVSFLACDITGGVKNVYDWLKTSDHKPLTIPEKACLPIDGASLVVSACVVSQLYHLPIKYISHKLAKNDAGFFAKAVVTQHINALDAFGGNVCLITEVERQICNGADVVDSEDPLHGVSIPFTAEEWWWDIAPAPEMHRNYSQRLRMMAALKTT